ncbi:MAG TPA: S53 family peptidase [Steroidobacteraceae bacterium]|nr:S53 family peptidase [Steroidobacteraceae bacterium]
MPSKSYREFSASHRVAPGPSCKLIGEVPGAERVEISIYLKPRDGEPAAPAKGADRRAAMRAHRAAQHAGDIELIRNFAREHGLTVSAVEPGRRLVRLSGTAAQAQAAFQTRLSHYSDGKRTFRARTGALSLPAELLPVVQSVLGLDTRPAAQPRLVSRPAAAAAAAFLPNEVAALYGFPASVSGKGQCIALIELGGGYINSDTSAAFKTMGLAAPVVVAVPVDGGANKPTPDDGADSEVALDIQVAGGVAPGAKIAVYFAPNTDAGFVDAITSAVHDSTNKPGVISISWGSAESNWTEQSVQSMNSALEDASTLDVSVCVASGDSLATDGVADGKAHVDFPASSPFAIGCGGTAITSSGNSITSEAVWNDGDSGTGGGISDLFAVPAFQQGTALPPSVNDGQTRRGVPDVAGDAAPDTGYRLVVGGKSGVVGGTSAVAPLWAGLIALINEGASKPVGFLLPFLYSHPTLLRQITQGDNIASGTSLGYEAGPGWNACTGLGVPRGQALFDALTANAS